MIGGVRVRASRRIEEPEQADQCLQTGRWWCFKNTINYKEYPIYLGSSHVVSKKNRGNFEEGFRLMLMLFFFNKIPWNKISFNKIQPFQEMHDIIIISRINAYKLWLSYLGTFLISPAITQLHVFPQGQWAIFKRHQLSLRQFHTNSIDNFIYKLDLQRKHITCINKSTEKQTMFQINDFIRGGTVRFRLQ